MSKSKSLYRSIIIIASVIILASVMNVVDGIIKPHYFIKSAIKIALFLVVPLVYFFIDKTELTDIKELFKPRLKPILLALVLGLVCYGAIVGGYFLLRDHLDFSNITASLTGNAGVSKDNFIFVALYISFCNSLLEEFFFRGISFNLLKKYQKNWVAYLFSAAVFAYYHIGMTFGWVNFLLAALGFIGLAAGGVIFNFFCDKTKSIYPSWIIHMFINFGINTVGCVLFGII